jgi:hypothetical protein
MLEIDFPASNVKIRQQLMTGQPYLDGAPRLRILGLGELDQTHLLAIKLDVADQIAMNVCTLQML